MGNAVVYRPAYDAEIEYLESDGNSYIDTGLKASSNLSLLAEIQYISDVSGNPFAFGGANGLLNNEYGFMCKGIKNESTFRFGDGNNVEPRLAIRNQKLLFDNTTNHNKLYVGDVLYEAPSRTFTSTYNLYLFKECRGGSALGDGSIRIYYFKLYNNDILVSDFIPVRIGTTGYMYDKVSRQLFANAGTGQFVLGNDVANATVPQLRHVVYFGGQRCVGFEKVYEKCAWLKGRNGAYIDTNYYPIVGTDVFSVHFRYDGTLRNPDGIEQDAFGATISGGRLSAYINGENYLSCNYCKVSNNYFPSTGKHSLDWNISNLRVDGENFKYDANNDSYSFSNREIPIATGSKTLYVFSCNQSASTYLHGDISSFKITDTSSNTKMNLIPCRLLVDIPAILDGNGIARQAGTCGMWDTVSGRFFGNVADRGTFDVVYFEEGVDYEVHDWLVAQIPRITGVNPMFKLPLNSDTFEFRIIMQSDTSINIGHIFTDKYWYYSTALSYIGVWDTVNRTSLLTTNIGSNDMTFKSNPSEFTINNTVITKYGFPATYKVFYNNAANTNATVYNSAISVNGSIRYIPCRLLRPIPSKYDANGITRQAGECGMYDTVNDLFYGNVASSGVFSVSDD